MSLEKIPLNIDDLLEQLKTLEEQSSSSALLIYSPSEEHEPFYINLCQIYLDASHRQRTVIRNAVGGKKGVLNRLLGLVYKSAERIRSTRDNSWLRIGLAAAAIQNDRLDYRDFLLALSELYLAAEQAGIDPDPEFEKAGGGVPRDFHRYAVLQRRREAL